MIQDDFPMWPSAMSAARVAQAAAPAQARGTEHAAELSATLRDACRAAFDRRDIAAAERAAIVADALAFLIVDAAGTLDLQAPAVSRIEWLLNRVSRTAWAVQLATKLPEPVVFWHNVDSRADRGVAGRAS